jgi:hypothetical protein
LFPAISSPVTVCSGELQPPPPIEPIEEASFLPYHRLQTTLFKCPLGSLSTYLGNNDRINDFFCLSVIIKLAIFNFVGNSSLVSGGEPGQSTSCDVFFVGWGHLDDSPSSGLPNLCLFSHLPHRFALQQERSDDFVGGGKVGLHGGK